MSYLFQSDNVAVRCVPADRRDRWVITFDHYGIGHGFDRLAFAEGFLGVEGVSAIHVMGRREDWYQYPEMGEVMAVVRQAVAGADRVLTYGSSMGAYAAIRFANATGANAALALSPQYSIDRAKVPFEHRWDEDSRRIEWRPEIDGRIDCGFAPVVVYDSTNNDGRQVELIRGDIAIQDVRVPHIGHPSSTVLAELGLLRGLVLDCLDGSIDVRACEAAVRARRGESPAFVSSLSEAQPPHRVRTAIALARRALEICSTSVIAMAALGHALTTAGEYEEAVVWLRAADESCSGQNLHVARRLAIALASNGALKEALVVAARAAALHPHLVRLEALERRLVRLSDPALARSRWRLNLAMMRLRWARLRQPASTSPA